MVALWRDQKEHYKTDQQRGRCLRSVLEVILGGPMLKRTVRRLPVAPITVELPQKITITLRGPNLTKSVATRKELDQLSGGHTDITATIEENRPVARADLVASKFADEQGPAADLFLGCTDPDRLYQETAAHALGTFHDDDDLPSLQVSAIGNSDACPRPTAHTRDYRRTKRMLLFRAARAGSEVHVAAVRAGVDRPLR